MQSVPDDAVAQPRFNITLMIMFGCLALVLSAVGTFGLLSSLVSQRSNEIGIRIALGATRWTVYRLVAEELARMAGTGVVIGWLAAALASRWLQSRLSGVTAYDPIVFAAVPAVVIAFVSAAAFPVARRAAGMDPARTLRG